MNKFNNIKTTTSGTISYGSTKPIKTKVEIPVLTFQSCSTFQTGNIISYSIPKQKRFKGNYNPPVCHSIYEIPESKTNKYTTMGYGFRTDIINRKEIENKPSPNQYNFNSLFMDNINKTKGFSMSQKFKYKENENKIFPGPGYYQSEKLDWLKKSPISMKFRKDFFYNDDVKSTNDVSPMKYLPETKITQNNRFRNKSISFGIGMRSYQIIIT